MKRNGRAEKNTPCWFSGSTAGEESGRRGTEWKCYSTGAFSPFCHARNNRGRGRFPRTSSSFKRSTPPLPPPPPLPDTEGVPPKGVNDSNDPGTNFWCEFGLTGVPGLLRPGVRKIQRRQNNRTDAKTASDAEFALIVPAVLFAAASC